MGVIGDQLWWSRVSAEEQARLVRYRMAWEAYFGQTPDPLATSHSDPRGQDNVKVNFVRPIVDKGVAMLFGQEPIFELDEMTTTPTEIWLEQCWRANHKMLTLQKMAINGGVCGHVFVKITQPQRGERYPRVINLSPEYVTVATEPDDIERVTLYLIEYPAHAEDGTWVTIRQRIEQDGARWHILDQRARGNGRFETISDVEWPYPWPPIIACQNLPSPNEYYGVSDVEEDVIRLNGSLMFVLSNMARIVRHHAHPKTWSKGVAASEIRTGVDDMIVLHSPEAELHNLEMQSDLSSSLALYERLKEALHEMSRTPEVAMGKMNNIGTLSGVALQILYRPLTEKTEAKRRTYGEMLVELNRRLLALGGYSEEQWVTIHWPELLPSDPLQERQVALIDQQLGVSADTLLSQLGYDAAQEAQKREVEDRALGESALTAWEQSASEP